MSILIDAELLLAPEKARQAWVTTYTAFKLHTELTGRAPSVDALWARFITEAVDLECCTADIEWLIAAELIPENVLPKWMERTGAHA